MTRQRKLILDIVNSAYDHPTARTVFERARERMPSIALGTVYRNLGIMADEGIIRRIVIPDHPERYDRANDPHDHIVCVNCGEISDWRFKGIMPIIESETGSKVVSYELFVRCVCEKCRSEKDRD